MSGDADRDAYLARMGLTRWVRRGPAERETLMPDSSALARGGSELADSGTATRDGGEPAHTRLRPAHAGTANRGGDADPAAAAVLFDEYASAFSSPDPSLDSPQNPPQNPSLNPSPEIAAKTGAGTHPAQTSAAPRTKPMFADMPAAQAIGDVRRMPWDELQATVAACRLCSLHATRKQTVFGVGARDADLMFIGEAPGADEDRLGEPFVGRAGKLLDEMLAAIGLGRERIYIANVLKCRPPNNRDPQPEEASSCSAYLNRQIELIAPKAIVALGRIAAQHLLGTTQSLGRMRGRTHPHPLHHVPVVVTYHPAYLLRTPADKAKAWADLLLAWQLLSASPS